MATDACHTKCAVLRRVRASVTRDGALSATLLTCCVHVQVAATLLAVQQALQPSSNMGQEAAPSADRFRGGDEPGVEWHDAEAADEQDMLFGEANPDVVHAVPFAYQPHVAEVAPDNAPGSRARQGRFKVLHDNRGEPIFPGAKMTVEQMAFVFMHYQCHIPDLVFDSMCRVLSLALPAGNLFPECDALGTPHSAQMHRLC
jgi:hypothetical protein